MIATVMASATLQLVFNSFARNQGVPHQCFRVKNLLPDEIRALVSLWSREAPDSFMKDVRLVISHDLDGTVDKRFVAEPGYSITHYRNNNDKGLVYVETQVQSDEQGLQNLFTLRDSNFLDGSFDDQASPGDSAPDLMLRDSWELLSKGGTPVPGGLRDRVLQIISLIHPEIDPVPVRRFVAFCLECAKSWRADARPKEAAVAGEVIGNCLYKLDLFPDAKWHESSVEARIRRRLDVNAKHADLIAGGAELDPDEISRLARERAFVDTNGIPLPSEQRTRFAELIERYVISQTDEIRAQIPYWIFEQLFSKDVAGLKLGEKIRVEIGNADRQRLDEFDQLDIIDGLNARAQMDAERLLQLEPPQGQKALADLITNRTLRIVERVASPAVMRFDNPLTFIVRHFLKLSNESDTGLSRIRIEIANPEEQNVSKGLFAFLWGPTLISLSEQLVGVPGACELEISPELCKPELVPPLYDEDDDETGQATGSVEWPALPLIFHFENRAGSFRETMDRVEWAPANIDFKALFWLLVAADDSPVWNCLGEFLIPEDGYSKDWMKKLVQRDQSLQSLQKGIALVEVDESPVTDRIIGRRQRLRTDLVSDGLSVEALNDYFDDWRTDLEVVRTECIPEGTRPKVLEAVLANDTIAAGESQHRLMLPLHPIRLRWIATYLERCNRLATECLKASASFAADDGDQYLDWLEALTPHESPPTASGASGEILHSRTEVSWFEDYAPLERVSADVTVDPHALGSICGRIHDYLDAHPFKRDGLAVLIVLPQSDDMPAELMRSAVSGASNARVSLTVAVPKDRWERIAQLVEALPGEERRTGKDLLFPGRDLSFIDFNSGGDLGAALQGSRFDISVVSHVLQESVISQQNTEPPSAGRAGGFDPVRDRPLRLESTGGSGAISIVMLPKLPDAPLETWGTLVVRANRNRPVSLSQPENVDFVELRINFQDSARIFHVLHSHSHWVITLERHISRDQIESVEAGSPDVLSMEGGIGGNGLNTLIVSSRSGRELIRARLSKKLRKVVPLGIGAGVDQSILDELARHVYDETRILNPHLALKAMGISRVTEEILGLGIARRLADEKSPAIVPRGVIGWLSLDEHTEWFGGASNVRADMCRVAICRNEDGTLDLDLLILEGKFRQSYDSHGEIQATRTCEFLEATLAGEGGGREAHLDAAMWRNRLLSALDNLPHGALSILPLADSDPTGEGIPGDIRQDIRDGKYRLRSVKGLYSICLWDNDESIQFKDVSAQVRVALSGRNDLLKLIGGGVSHQPAAEAVPSAEFTITAALEESSGAAKAAELQSHAEEESRPSAQLSPEGERAPVETTPIEPLAATESVELGLTAQRYEPTVIQERRGMSAERLLDMYNEILGCFDAHNVSVSAAPQKDQPFVEGPASVLFRVSAGKGVDPKKLYEKAQALKLRLALEQDQNVTFDIDKGYVTIDVPKNQDLRYYVNARDLWVRWTRPASELCVPLGEDRYGELVEVNFSSPNSPHLLVAGTTGSGKSEALNTMLFGLIMYYGPEELRLLLVDPKGTELVPFEGDPHLLGKIGWEDTDAIVLLKQAVEQMQQRNLKFREHGCRNLQEFNSTVAPEKRFPWWLVVLDEYADLTHDPQGKKDIEQELKRLAQKARSAGIHVIIATQKPSAEVISTNLRSNLPAQLALRVKSGTESRVIMDEGGAENLNGRGDALLKADGKLRRLQCARVMKEDQQRALKGAAVLSDGD